MARAADSGLTLFKMNPKRIPEKSRNRGSCFSSLHSFPTLTLTNQALYLKSDIYNID